MKSWKLAPSDRFPILTFFFFTILWLLIFLFVCKGAPFNLCHIYCLENNFLQMWPWWPSPGSLERFSPWHWLLLLGLRHNVADLIRCPIVTGKQHRRYWTQATLFCFYWYSSNCTLNLVVLRTDKPILEFNIPEVKSRGNIQQFYIIFMLIIFAFYWHFMKLHQNDQNAMVLHQTTGYNHQ